MKPSAQTDHREDEMNFAYISTGVLVLFVLLAAMHFAGQRDHLNVHPLPNIEAH
jgi:hypothetical protein